MTTEKRLIGNKASYKVLTEAEDSLSASYVSANPDVINTTGVNFGECISLVSVDSVRLEHKKKKRREDTAAEKAERRYYLRNMAFLIAGFCFNYTAYLALQALQSSLNSQGGVGVLSLAAMFAGIMVSSAFICPYVISRFGERRVLQFGTIAFANLIAGNAVGNNVYLVFSFFMFGLVSGTFFPSQFRYVSLTSKAYAAVTGQTLDIVLTKFSGAFFTFFVATHFTGNLISSLILEPRKVPVVSTLYNSSDRFNFTTLHNDHALSTEHSTAVLPAKAGSINTAGNTNQEDSSWYYGNCPASGLGIKLAVDETSRLVLMGTFGVLIILGGLCLLSLRPVNTDQPEGGRVTTTSSRRTTLSLETDSADADTSPEESEPLCWSRLSSWPMFDTIRMAADIKMRRLIPLMVTVGVLKSFIYDDFNHFFVAQCLGTYRVGYSMACYGAANAIANVVMMKIAVRMGRVVLVAGGCTAAIVMLAFALAWHKEPNQAVLFMLSSIWGMVDATWNPQISALLGVIFRDCVELAYANYTFYSAVGFCMSFVISTVTEGTYMSPFIKMGLITIGLPISFIFYYKTEREYAASQQDAIRVNVGASISESVLTQN